MGHPLLGAMHLARFNKNLLLAPTIQLPGMRPLEFNFIEKTFAI
jgi:hypothetical protein